MEQLPLFPEVIEEYYLKSDSKRNAFYHIKLMYAHGFYVVAKESGIGETVIDSRVWVKDSREDGLKMIRKKVKQKTSKNRERVYVSE